MQNKFTRDSRACANSLIILLIKLYLEQVIRVDWYTGESKKSAVS